MPTYKILMPPIRCGNPVDGVEDKWDFVDLDEEIALPLIKKKKLAPTPVTLKPVSPPPSAPPPPPLSPTSTPPPTTPAKPASPLTILNSYSLAQLTALPHIGQVRATQLHGKNFSSIAAAKTASGLNDDQWNEVLLKLK